MSTVCWVDHNSATHGTSAESYTLSSKLPKKALAKASAFFCERVTKRSKIEVKVSKSSVAIKNIAYTPVLLLIH